MEAKRRCGRGGSTWDDDALVARAVAGDPDAINDVLQGAQRYVTAACWRVLRNHHDAADAAQHALISIARAIHTFDGRASFRAWTHRIATNAALDEVRRRERRAVPAEMPSELREATPSLASGVVDRLTIAAAFDRLPDEFRRAVELRDLHGHDYEAIAAMLGVPTGTVRSRISRGRARLASQLVAA